MLASFALLLLSGLFLSLLFQRAHLPGLLGMLIAGIVLGPYAFDLLDNSLLAISPEIRQLALIVILARAGLLLNADELKKVGRPAVLMCFLPAFFEMAGVMLVASKFLHLSLLEAALAGAVLVAVSPAIVVPKMSTLMKTHYGTEKAIPQMLIAGGSVDAIFAVVIFSAVIGIAQGGTLSALALLRVPVSILLGIAGGSVFGLVLNRFFITFRMPSQPQAIVFFCASILAVAFESVISFPFSGLLAVMGMGAAIRGKNKTGAARLSKTYEILWFPLEILLFALVGAAIDLPYTFAAGGTAIFVVFCALLFRSAGVWICLLRTAFSTKERFFCTIAYLPKATVQAALGAIPLSFGLPCGPIILALAALSILITTPLGALGIDLLYPRLLRQNL